jgi:hypothetical protein
MWFEKWGIVSTSFNIINRTEPNHETVVIKYLLQKIPIVKINRVKSHHWLFWNCFLKFWRISIFECRSYTNEAGNTWYDNHSKEVLRKAAVIFVKMLNLTSEHLMPQKYNKEKLRSTVKSLRGMTEWIPADSKNYGNFLKFTNWC